MTSLSYGCLGLVSSLSGLPASAECHWFLVMDVGHMDNPLGYLGLTWWINTPPEEAMMLGIVVDNGAHVAMMGWGMVLCVVVTQIDLPRGPEDVEVALLAGIVDPVEPHVNYVG
jgi:hypothetical protein